MSNGSDITSMTPRRRAELVYDAYGYRPDRRHLADAGLELIRQRERAKAKGPHGKDSKIHVVRRSRVDVDSSGHPVEVWDYLGQHFEPHSMARLWGTAATMKQFGSKREADRARQWKGEGEVVTFADLPATERGLSRYDLMTGIELGGDR